MARYRSNKGREGFVNVVRRVSMLSEDTAEGAGLLDKRPDEGGAGSIDVYTLSSNERYAS